jgi:hypothetical protein
MDTRPKAQSLQHIYAYHSPSVRRQASPLKSDPTTLEAAAPSEGLLMLVSSWHALSALAASWLLMAVMAARLRSKSVNTQGYLPPRDTAGPDRVPPKFFSSSARNLSSLNRFVNQMQFAPRLQINRSAGRPGLVPVPPPVQDTGPLGLHQPATPRIELQPRTALAPLTLETVLGGAGLASCQCSKQNGPPSRCGSTAQACRRSIVGCCMTSTRRPSFCTCRGCMPILPFDSHLGSSVRSAQRGFIGQGALRSPCQDSAVNPAPPAERGLAALLPSAALKHFLKSHFFSILSTEALRSRVDAVGLVSGGAALLTAQMRGDPWRSLKRSIKARPPPPPLVAGNQVEASRAAVGPAGGFAKWRECPGQRTAGQ